MTYGAQNVDLRSILTTIPRWGILLAIQCFFTILCTYHSSRDNGGFPKQCLVLPKFWVFGPWGAQFWLNSKMILVFLVDLVTPNQMPFTVCFYVASFSRSLGGRYPPPPPPPVLSWLRPPPVRGLRQHFHSSIFFFALNFWLCSRFKSNPRTPARLDLHFQFLKIIFQDLCTSILNTSFATMSRSQVKKDEPSSAMNQAF